MKESKDKFSNKFYGSATESAANTLTFGEIQTNVDVFSKNAWILHRLEWYLPAATRALMVDNYDAITLSLCSSDKITALELDSAGVIDLYTIEKSLATSVGYMYFQYPLIRDFSSLPGGGLIVSPRPLYVGIKGTGLAAVSTGEVRGYFTKLELSADEYLELVDFYRIVQ